MSKNSRAKKKETDLKSENKYTFLSLLKVFTFTIGVGVITTGISSISSISDIFVLISFSILYLLLSIDLIKPEIDFDYRGIGRILRIVSYCYTCNLFFIMIVMGLYFNNNFKSIGFRISLTKDLFSLMALLVLIEALFSMVMYYNYATIIEKLGRTKIECKNTALQELLFSLVYFLFALSINIFTRGSIYHEEYYLILLVVVLTADIKVYNYINKE